MSLPHGYEMVIGLEVHAQVNTHSKLFSASATTFGAEPNTQANEIDLGMPGMLPVLNSAAVDAGIKLGLAINATVNHQSVFARKNYYYPDLPKGYQISQFEHPIVSGGTMDIEVEGSVRTIGITRMHLEEDAGKSIHDMGTGNVSFVDLNRAGVPLMEIVSEPDLRTPEEAGAYLKKLRTLLRFLDICDGDMEKGNFRCDANVSVRKPNEPYRTRCEIKNLNSVRHVMAAIQHEALRHIEVWESGKSVDQETRLWDPDTQETRTLRSKEDAHDYRYFPDPDLLPLRLDEARIEKIRGTLPKLPDAIKAEYLAMGLNEEVSTLLASDKSYVDFYREVLQATPTPGRTLTVFFDIAELPPLVAKIAANWMTVELFGALNKMNIELENSPISAKHLGELIGFTVGGGLIDNTPTQISGKIAKQVFATMLENPGKSPTEIIEAQGLKQNSNTDELRAHVIAALQGSPDAVAKYKAGNERILGSFVGQVMKATKGQANPEMVNQLLLEEIAKL